MRTLLAVGVVAFAWSAPDAQALCVVPSQHPVVMNSGVDAPMGGGLLVSTSNSGPNEGEAMQPTWVLQSGTRSEPPVVRTLAPGLVVYALPAGMPTADLFDGKASRGTVTATTVAVAEQPARLAAPAVKRITHVRVAGPRGSSGTTTVTLRAVPPEGAVAMIVLDAKSKRAMSYGFVVAGAMEVVVYAQARCSALPNGTVETVARSKVLLEWVDRYGRVSSPSKPTRVARGAAA